MKVLVAEDETVSRRLLELSLRKWGYDVVVAADGLEAEEILQQPDAPHLLVLDWLMPGLDGIQLCRNIRQENREPYTYVLLLTSKRGQGDVVEGLESGADDYLTKPFDPQELKVRLRTGKRILYLLDQLVAAREALRDRALHDGLTGLWNRAAVVEALERELERSHRHGTSVGLIMFDLDHFKAINDTYGHSTGDEVLAATAKATRETIRRYDAAGRYGGEEFLIVLPGCDETTTVSHAERLRAAISRISIPSPKCEVHATASFGVSVSSPGFEFNSHELIEAADAALYRAKQSGRNRVELGALEMASA